MICIKTGANVLLTGPELIIHGDAFQLLTAYMEAMQLRYVNSRECWLLIRVCSTEHLAEEAVQVNITGHYEDHWFDRNNIHAKDNSTILISPGKWDWLSYEGTEVKL